MVAANRVEEDRRCTSIREAVKFAKANNLLGVMLDATILVRRSCICRRFVRTDHGTESRFKYRV